MSRAAIVKLGELMVGRLLESDDAMIEFRLDPEYQALPQRPVLGQWFEDRQRALQRGDRPGELPAFFANLIPEGDLRLTIQERLGVVPGDDLGLLGAVGADLPGALVVELESGERPPTTTISEPRPDDRGLRFSLAGVQLKFSMVRTTDRFSMPGRDQHGSWIAKIAYDAYPDLAVNEWTTMEWARHLGFDVPRTELRPLVDLVGAPYDGAPDAQVYLIERYDRSANGSRVHQEDFQQIVGRRPDKKYDDMTYDKLIFLASRIVLPSRIDRNGIYRELVRRLAFIVASGNDDAHMKNWSVIYPDGVSAQLSPLYDQVFTARWPRFAQSLALKVDGAKDFAALTLGNFREMARRIQAYDVLTAEIVEQTISQAAGAWRELRDHPNVSDEYRQALRRHWLRVPMLRPHALAM
jgi:serine/threonine-protein kinase HipA